MTNKINYWKETRSGIRSSTTMLIGVLLTSASAIFQFGLPYFVSQDAGAGDSLVAGLWLLWILGLWVLGISFIWVGIQPFLSHFGIVVGLFHLVQGTYLLVLLFANSGAMIPPVIISVGRLMSIFLFGFVERGNIGVPLSILVWVSALLQLLKISLRVLGALPQMSLPVQSAIDTFFLLLVCIALARLGKHLKHRENTWAREKYLTRSSGLADFNNPTHDWD